MNMTESVIPQQELRIAIRFNTVNVPGKPLDRPKRIAEDFATFMLSRSFSYDYDFIHLTPDVFLPTSQSVWILCDFNICDKVREVATIPIQWWYVRYDQQQSP